jgi:hypothetical protein
VAVAGAAAAFANGNGVSRASRIYEVSGEGGAYEVAVHPEYITLLHLPDPVVRAFASNRAAFDVYPYQGRDLVAVRPRTDRPADGNLVIITRSVRIGVHLYTADKREAVFQVFFRRRAREEEIRTQVAREVAHRLAQAAEQEALVHIALSAHARRNAEIELLERLLVRVEQRPFQLPDRGGADPVLWVRNALWIGDDVYLFFELQNRDSTPYRPRSVTLSCAGEVVSGLSRFAGATGRSGEEAEVMPGERRVGLVVVPAATRLRGRSLHLELAEAEGVRPVAIEGIQLQ